MCEALLQDATAKRVIKNETRTEGENRDVHTHDTRTDRLQTHMCEALLQDATAKRVIKNETRTEGENRDVHTHDTRTDRLQTHDSI